MNLFLRQSGLLRIWLSLLLISTTFLPGSRANAQTVLQGKIEHSASLPAVDSQWKTGAKFNPAKLPVTGSASVVWWRVPNWLAGTWKNAGKVKRLSLKDVEHPEAEQGFDAIEVKYPDAEVIGYQQDLQGSVWTCVPAPYVGRTEQDPNMNVSIIYSAVPVEISESQVVLKFLATTLTVEKAKGKIVSVTQRESLQTYKPIAAGKVLIQASMKFFDEDGKARYESKTLSQSRLEEAYKETPYLPASGAEPTLIDMRKSFEMFLHSKHLDYLIPKLTPLPPVQGYKMITI